MGVDEFLDLLGVDVLAAADDHVLEPAGDAVVALRRLAGEVARMQPAVLVDGLAGGVGSCHPDKAIAERFHEVSTPQG